MNEKVNEDNECRPETFGLAAWEWTVVDLASYLILLVLPLLVEPSARARSVDQAAFWRMMVTISSAALAGCSSVFLGMMVRHMGRGKQAALGVAVICLLSALRDLCLGPPIHVYYGIDSNSAASMLWHLTIQCVVWTCFAFYCLEKFCTERGQGRWQWGALAAGMLCVLMSFTQVWFWARAFTISCDPTP